MCKQGVAPVSDIVFYPEQIFRRTQVFREETDLGKYVSMEQRSGDDRMNRIVAIGERTNGTFKPVFREKVTDAEGGFRLPLDAEL